MEEGTTLLLGLSGVAVSHVERHDDGTRVVHVVTADEYAGVCPGCGVVSTSLKETAVTGRATSRMARTGWSWFGTSIVGAAARLNVRERHSAKRSRKCLPGVVRPAGCARRSRTRWRATAASRR